MTDNISLFITDIRDKHSALEKKINSLTFLITSLEERIHETNKKKYFELGNIDNKLDIYIQFLENLISSTKNDDLKINKKFDAYGDLINNLIDALLVSPEKPNNPLQNLNFLDICIPQLWANDRNLVIKLFLKNQGNMISNELTLFLFIQCPFDDLQYFIETGASLFIFESNFTIESKRMFLLSCFFKNVAFSYLNPIFHQIVQENIKVFVSKFRKLYYSVDFYDSNILYDEWFDLNNIQSSTFYRECFF
jgi:hypothetical protein